MTPKQKITVLEDQLQEVSGKVQLFDAVFDVLRTDYGVRVEKRL